MGRNDAPPAGDDRTPDTGLTGAPGAPPSETGSEPPVGGGWPAEADAAGMLQMAMELLSPAEAARQMPWLISELTKIATGQSELEYAPRDVRFADPTWRANPAFRGLGLTYRLVEEWAGRMAGAVEGSWEQSARATYLANIMTAALAPTN